MSQGLVLTIDELLLLSASLSWSLMLGLSANIVVKLAGFMPVSTRCFINLRKIRVPIVPCDALLHFFLRFLPHWTSSSQTRLSSLLLLEVSVRNVCLPRGEDSSYRSYRIQVSLCIMMTTSITRAAPSTASTLTASVVHSMMHPGTSRIAQIGRGLAFLSVSSLCFFALSCSLLASSSSRSLGSLSLCEY